MNDQNGEVKLEERILQIKRVTKKTTGGNYVTFSALVAVGNGHGNVGVALGRGLEVPQAIKKALLRAKKTMITVPLYKSTIPHQIKMKFKAGKIFLKPAPEGTGLKIGSVARVIFDLAGIHNASGKIIGSRNQTVNTYLVMAALKKLKMRNLPVAQEVAHE
ncbi:MAG: 30S ribosomal protein S5 [Patescibacteria group bacterium]